MSYLHLVWLVFYSFLFCYNTFLFVKTLNNLLLQKRQSQAQSKSRSEKFNPHLEEASGFPIDPPRPSQAVEVGIEPQVPQHKRASHSGPLAHRTAWAKSGKNQDDAPKISVGGDLSTISGLVAARSMLSDDRRERSGSSQMEASKLMNRFPGSFKDISELLIKQDQRHHVPGQVGTSQKEEGRSSNKDLVLVSSLMISTLICSVIVYV